MANSPGSGRVSARTPAKLGGLRSPSPAHGRPATTTAVPPSRSTGRWCAPRSATTATTPPQNCCYATKAWQLQSKLATYVYPPQKLVAKVRAGAKVSDNHDQATTLFHHAIDHPTVTVQQTYSLINPQSAPGRWTLIRWGPAGSLVLRITLCRVSELPARRSPRSNARDRCQAGTRISWVSIRSATKKVSKPACVR